MKLLQKINLCVVTSLLASIATKNCPEEKTVKSEKPVYKTESLASLAYNNRGKELKNELPVLFGDEWSF